MRSPNRVSMRIEERYEQQSLKSEEDDDNEEEKGRHEPGTFLKTLRVFPERFIGTHGSFTFIEIVVYGFDFFPLIYHSNIPITISSVGAVSIVFFK